MKIGNLTIVNIENVTHNARYSILTKQGKISIHGLSFGAFYFEDSDELLTAANRWKNIIDEKEA
jgi:hypothetical protein